MVNYEIVGVTKTAQSFNFEITVEGYVKSFWIMMPKSMYERMTAEQIKDHINHVVQTRYGDVIITSEENTKLDSIMTNK